MLKFLKEIFNPKDIIKTMVQTFTGTVLIGSFIVVLSDFVFGTPDFTGRWTLRLVPEKSASRLVEVMNLEYTLLVTQSGLELSGVGEKTRAYVVKDNKNNKDPFTEVYDPGDPGRVRIELEGFIKKHYLKSIEIYFSYNEMGTSRESATIAKLYYINEDHIEGIYESTIGDARGKVIIKREANLEE